MTQCANCGLAEASFLCSLSGDSRCSYCRTLARRPEEYRTINPKPQPNGKPALTWDSILDLNSAGMLTGRWPAASGPYIAAVGDQVKIVEDWTFVYNSKAPNRCGAVGKVMAAGPPLPPPGGLRLGSNVWFYSMVTSATIVDGYFVVERAP